MQTRLGGSGHFDQRHELEGLAPVSVISVGPAMPHEIAGLAAIARREIPGIKLSEASLEHFLRADPESIFAFRRGNNLLGGIDHKQPQGARDFSAYEEILRRSPVVEV